MTVGLFGFGKKKQSRASTQSPNRLKIPIGKTYELPVGDYDGYVIVADARPVGKLRVGDTVRMVLVKGDHDLIEASNGAWIRSRQYENTNCCLTYDGYGIGYMIGQKDLVSAFVGKYGKVAVMVRYDGINPRTKDPVFFALLPQPGWFRAELGIPEPQAFRDPLMTKATLSEQVWEVNAQDGAYAIELRELPVPEGSSAKPHIEVLLGGVRCAEVSARHGAYKRLSPLIGAELEVCYLTHSESDVGGTSYTLEIHRKP